MLWGSERLSAGFCRLKLPEETPFDVLNAVQSRLLRGEEEKKQDQDPEQWVWEYIAMRTKTNKLLCYGSLS